MTDIVDRLKEGVYGSAVTKTDEVLHALMHEAAAEIERLRAGGCARDQNTTQYCAELMDAIRAEREACASIADTYDWFWMVRARQHRRRHPFKG